MTTVAQIADEAFDNVALAITDAIKTATLSSVANGSYNYDTGAYSTTTTTISGRCVIDSQTPASDIFPDYVIGPNEQIMMLEGFSSVPYEGWTLTLGSKTYTVKRVQDIVGAGAIQMIVALEIPA